MTRHQECVLRRFRNFLDGSMRKLAFAGEIQNFSVSAHAHPNSRRAYQVASNSYVFGSVVKDHHVPPQEYRLIYPRIVRRK